MSEPENIPRKPSGLPLLWAAQAIDDAQYGLSGAIGVTSVAMHLLVTNWDKVADINPGAWRSPRDIDSPEAE